MDATMLCRPVAKGEKPEAMMGTKGIVCKSLDKMMAGGHMGPNTKAMDKAATDKAWQEWLDQAMLVPAALGSGAGG
jgi:pyruvate kinase